MDTKEAGSRGGKSAWKGLSKKRRSEIMSERNKKRWQKLKEYIEKRLNSAVEDVK